VISPWLNKMYLEFVSTCIIVFPKDGNLLVSLNFVVYGFQIVDLLATNTVFFCGPGSLVGIATA